MRLFCSLRSRHYSDRWRGGRQHLMCHLRSRKIQLSTCIKRIIKFAYSRLNSRKYIYKYNLFSEGAQFLKFYISNNRLRSVSCRTVSFQLVQTARSAHFLLWIIHCSVCRHSSWSDLVVPVKNILSNEDEDSKTQNCTSHFPCENLSSTTILII